ncbi:hypothetical protein D3C87_324460 [compost metagenome]
MTQRKRYCDIKAHSLEDVLTTCERHIRNIGLTRFDMIEEGDITPTDEFYIKMFKDTWADLRDDVEQILKERK